MPKAAEPLDCNELAQKDILLADRIEHCNSCTHDRCVFYRVDVQWDSHHGFRAEKNIFCIATIHGDTVDGFMLANLKYSALAGLADMVVT